MSDNIILPRADAKVLRELLEAYDNPDWWDGADYAALTALDAALAEPEQKSAFQVDAERYRWLRGEVQGPHTPLAQVVWKRNNIRESGDWTNLSDGHALDEAIDAALAEPEPESKTPAWWMDGLTVTLMREGVNKHRAREIAVGYWEAYCQIPGNEEDKT